MAREENANYPVRGALMDAAARLIATEGPAALTLRRVADEVGASTMAIYTHFGGMPELRRAVRREGFARLAAHLDLVDESDDPVADLAMLGRAYYENAISNPDLYRVMFMEQAVDPADSGMDSEDTFDALIACVKRCIASGRFAPAEPCELATQYWALGHGVVALQLAQLLTRERAQRCLADAALNLFTGYGDSPNAANRSVEHARTTTATPAGPATTR